MGSEVTQTLGAFAPFSYGKGLPERDRNQDGQVPVFGSNGIVGYHDSPLTDGPTIVIGRKGTVGAVHYSPVPCWPIDTTFFVSDSDPAVLRFKYYLLKSLGLENMNADSAVPGLNRDAAHARQVRVSPLPEQRAIAHILGTLDDKIELNRRMNETLEAMARAIFKSWFVDFDPVRAKMEGRPTGLPEEIEALFPDSFEDSELGEIPMGWRVVALPEAIEVNPSRSLTKGQVALYLDMQGMPTTGHRYIELTARPFSSGTKFLNSDTLLARITPCLENGKTAFVDFLENGQVGWGSTEYIIFRPKPPLPVEYGYYLARSDALREYAIQNMTGTSGRQRVPPSCFDNYLMVAPPASIAQMFGGYAKSVMAKVRTNDDESRTLATIRDALLPKLLSGKIRVNGAEKFLKERGL